jgi:hypothetical protein
MRLVASVARLAASRRAACVTALVTAFASTLVQAQDAEPTPRPCNGEVVVAISVRTLRSSELDRAQRYGPIGSIANFMYKRTSWDVVRSFLFVREGRRCTELARTESERVLRSQPFLADARIRVVPVAPDSIQLDVATEDELPLIVGGRIQHGSIGGVKLGNSNIGGYAMSAEVSYQRGFAYRDGFGARFSNHQLMGNPWTLSLEAARYPLGGSWGATLHAPFYSELRPRSWYVGAVALDAFYPLERTDGPDVSVRVDRVQWMTALAWRLGRSGKSWLAGPLLHGERSNGGTAPVIVTDSGLVPYDGTDLPPQDYGYRSVRAGGVMAVRAFRRVVVRGFDALNGLQDLANGIDVVAVGAHSIASIRGVERDVLLGGSLYAGRATTGSLIALQAQAEASRPRSTGEWQGVLATARAAWYRKASVNRLETISAEFAGGWNSRLPMQVTFSEYSNGMRGFGKASIGGGQRLIVRAEERWLIPQPWQRVDVGAAIFAEGGRLWAGDAPFGVTTPWQSSVGISLLGATPRRSKRLLRVDIAVPLTHAGRPDKIELRAGIGDRTRWFWKEPSEVQRMRDGGLLQRILDTR